MNELIHIHILKGLSIFINEKNSEPANICKSACPFGYLSCKSYFK